LFVKESSLVTSTSRMISGSLTRKKGLPPTRNEQKSPYCCCVRTRNPNGSARNRTAIHPGMIERGPGRGCITTSYDNHASKMKKRYSLSRALKSEGVLCDLT